MSNELVTYPHAKSGLLGVSIRERLRLAILLCAFCAGSTVDAATIPLTDGSTIEFASIEAAKKLLSTSDEFTKRVETLERQYRLQAENPVEEKTHLAFAAEQALEWTDEDKTKITRLVKELQEPLAKLELTFPKTISFVKTTGKEEAGAAYCRFPGRDITHKNATAPGW